MPSAPSSGSFVHAYGFLENALRNLNTPYTLPPAAQIYLDRAHQLWSRHHYNQRLLASHNCLSPALQGAAMGSLIFPSFPQASAGKMSQTIQLLTSHRSLALLLGSYTLKDWKLMVTLIYEAAGDLGLTSVLHDVFSPFFPAISNELSTILTAIPRDSLALESTPVWQSRLTCTPSPQGGSKAALRRRRRKKGTREQQVSDSQAGKRTATTAGHSALTKAAYSQHNNSTETSPSYKALTRTDFSAEASLSSTAASAIVPPSLQRFTFTVPRRGMTPSQLKSGRKSSSSSSYSTYLQNPSSHAYPPMMKAALTPSPLPPSVPDRSSSSSSYKLEPLSLRLQDLEMMFTRPMVPLRSAGQKNVKASASSMESSNGRPATGVKPLSFTFPSGMCTRQRQWRQMDGSDDCRPPSLSSRYSPYYLPSVSTQSAPSTWFQMHGRWAQSLLGSARRNSFHSFDEPSQADTPTRKVAATPSGSSQPSASGHHYSTAGSASRSDHGLEASSSSSLGRGKGRARFGRLTNLSLEALQLQARASLLSTPAFTQRKTMSSCAIVPLQGPRMYEVENVGPSLSQ